MPCELSAWEPGGKGGFLRVPLLFGAATEFGNLWLKHDKVQGGGMEVVKGLGGRLCKEMTYGH